MARSSNETQGTKCQSSNQHGRGEKQDLRKTNCALSYGQRIRKIEGLVQGCERVFLPPTRKIQRPVGSGANRNLLKKIRLLSKQEAQKMRSWNREREGRTLAIAGSREGKLIYPSAHARVVMALLVVGPWGCA